MKSCTINLNILLTGNMQHPKGMSNSEFSFITMCLAGVSWKTITAFTVLADWLAAKNMKF